MRNANISRSLYRLGSSEIQCQHRLPPLKKLERNAHAPDLPDVRGKEITLPRKTIFRRRIEVAAKPKLFPNIACVPIN